MLARLARRNLLHNPRRFAASASGVGFSVILVLVQLGLFAGLARNASQLIDSSPGDIWITSRNAGNFQWGSAVPRPHPALLDVRDRHGDRLSAHVVARNCRRLRDRQPDDLRGDQ